MEPQINTDDVILGVSQGRGDFFAVLYPTACLSKILYLVIASRYQRRGDPGSLGCFVANTPRNDDQMISPYQGNHHVI